ncbi:peptidoglycan-binding protein [Maricaulis sp.]|uniref:peptidoglycan-binding protein n=1 Tax=Maricaulis sp. TaxID=1486257 RepID=UPI003A90E992
MTSTGGVWMMDRVTALLTQVAATILVVIGLVAILGYTHSRAYRAGYCASEYCPEDSTRPWWRFGRASPPGPADPATGSTDYPSRYDPDFGYYSPDSYDSPATGDNGSPYSGSVLYGDAAANRPGDRTVSGSSGLSFNTGPVRDRDSRGFSLFPNTRSRYFETPGQRICAAGQDGPDAPRLARCWLNVGDAYQAVGRTDEARDAWDQSLIAGSYGGGAQAALIAQQRLQTAVLQLSCPTSTQSLARIAYGASEREDSGDIIQLISRQRAMAALGFYSGPVDGSYGPVTRRSVRDFQREMGFDQTGALNSQETVTLICHAALNARDADSQNLLGIMFATGLGVEQNIDSALEWLDTAADRGNGSANFNLALIYGTGTIQGSYRLCGLIESPERADSYLRRAADLGHERARRLRQEFTGGDSPADRWAGISRALLAEAERTGDRFYLAWQQRVDEARRENGQELNLPGCYQAAMDGGHSAAAENGQAD